MIMYVDPRLAALGCATSTSDPKDPFAIPITSSMAALSSSAPTAAPAKGKSATTAATAASGSPMTWAAQQQQAASMNELKGSFVLLRLPPGLKQLCYHFLSVFDAMALGRSSWALRKIIINNPEMKLAGVYRARHSEPLEALAHYGGASLVITHAYNKPLACSSEVERCISLAVTSGALRSLQLHEASSWLMEQLYNLTHYRTSSLVKRQLPSLPNLLALHVDTLTDTSGAFLAALPLSLRSLTIVTYDWLRADSAALKAGLARLVNLTAFSTTMSEKGSLPFGYLEMIVTSCPRLTTLQVGGPRWNDKVFTDGLVTVLPSITRLIVQEQSQHCATIARVMPSLTAIHLELTQARAEFASLESLLLLPSLESISLVATDAPGQLNISIAQWNVRTESFFTKMLPIAHLITDLHLRYMPINAVDMVDLARCVNLQRLVIEMGPHASSTTIRYRGVPSCVTIGVQSRGISTTWPLLKDGRLEVRTHDMEQLGELMNVLPATMNKLDNIIIACDFKEFLAHFVRNPTWTDTVARHGVTVSAFHIYMSVMDHIILKDVDQDEIKNPMEHARVIAAARDYKLRNRLTQAPQVAPHSVPITVPWLVTAFHGTQLIGVRPSQQVLYARDSFIDEIMAPESPIEFGARSSQAFIW